METFTIQEAKAHLSQLVERAAKGESFVIAKAGKPMVKVVPIEQLEALQPFGFMKNEIQFPDDFDTMAADEIARMFGVEK